MSPDALGGAGGSMAPRSRCEITVVMPSPRMLTPYSASATSMVAFWCAITISAWLDAHRHAVALANPFRTPAVTA